MSLPREATYLPTRAMPRFGVGAFRGSIAPSSSMAADQRASAPEPTEAPYSPTRGIRPVDVTSFSAGNSMRNGVIGILASFWRWRRPMSSEVFIGVDHYQGSANREMARPQRLTKVVANKETFYEAQSYGEGPTGHVSHRGVPKRRF